MPFAGLANNGTGLYFLQLQRRLQGVAKLPRVDQMDGDPGNRREVV